MGIVKEVFADHTLDGNPIPENIFFIGSVSPFSHADPSIVIPLPPSLDEVTLHNGSITAEQEAAFITAILNMRYYLNFIILNDT